MRKAVSAARYNEKAGFPAQYDRIVCKTWRYALEGEPAMQEYSTVIGIDLGDKESTFAVMDSDSDEIQFEGRVATTRKAFERCFSK